MPFLRASVQSERQIASSSICDPDTDSISVGNRTAKREGVCLYSEDYDEKWYGHAIGN